MTPGYSSGAESGALSGRSKSGYTLFNPTPPELMREMLTDRPDKTEALILVDAGHFQIEADVLNYTISTPLSAFPGGSNSQL